MRQTTLSSQHKIPGNPLSTLSQNLMNRFFESHHGATRKATFLITVSATSAHPRYFVSLLWFPLLWRLDFAWRRSPFATRTHTC